MREVFVQVQRGRGISALAERQHGVVTRRQLLELGLSDDGIGRRVRDGRLHRVHQGVYALGRPTLTTRGRFLAAVVSCGPAAALSHIAAGILWGLLPERGARIDVTVPRGGQRRRRGAVIIHRSALPESDVTVNGGIRVTTPARTLIDLADVLPRRRAIRGRRGSGVLADALADHRAGSTRTRSELEERMLSLCQSFRLHPPEVNTSIEGYTVDFVWHEQTLIVETDGWQAHGTRTAFERDRRRDAGLLAAGWRVLRISYRQLEDEAAWVAARIGEALRA